MNRIETPSELPNVRAERLGNDRPGGFRPERPIQPGPPFQWPPQPRVLFKWLFGFPGYLWPWNALYLGIAFLAWRFSTPDTDTAKNLSAGWIGLLLVQNLVVLVFFVGAWHIRLYVQKAQGTNYKYNSRWLSVDDPIFLFRNQLWDNAFLTVCSAVPIWTAYEVLTFWLQANGIAPTVSWHVHPIYCVFLILITPMWLQIHFYAFHRLIHWPPLYRSVHSVHHKNINIGPWSGLAMHPVEHLLLFSGVGIFWILPSHPVHSLYLFALYALGPALSHLGFDRVVISKRVTLKTDDYMHYLHHKYVKVNYGDVLVPLDRWLGTFYDGSETGLEVVKRRMRARVGRGLRRD